MNAIREELNRAKAGKDESEQEMAKLRALYEQKMAEVEVKESGSTDSS